MGKLQVREPSPDRVISRGRPANSRLPMRQIWLIPALLLWLAAAALAQTPPSVSQSADSSRMDRLESMLESVNQQNRELSDEVRELKQQLLQRAPAPAPATPREPVTAESPTFTGAPPPPVDSALIPPAWDASPFQQSNSYEDFRVGYDNGFFIASRNMDEAPFSLKVNSQNVFRYSGFSPGAPYWTDSSGTQLPIDSSSNFQIPRGRLIFSGKALDPRLSYLLNIDYNTVNSNPIGFRAYELSYQFSRAFELHVGQSKVPGSREWLESAFAPLEGPDRSMATTFFRPSLSQGVWITGQPRDNLYYHLMMSNGFNTLNLRPNQLNNRFCWSGSSWWEPWGDFGRGYADLEGHAEPVIRVGASYSFAFGRGSQTDSDAVENSPIRLSDGTLITQIGALAPGVTLQTYDISLAAIDIAYKYQGLSLSTEWYAQELSALKGNAPLPLQATQAYGGFVQGGYFVVPQTVELYSRGSIVTGQFGSGSEIAGGVNWFLLPGKSNLRFTFDTAWLESSPASQNRTGYVAGQTGLLIRTQIAATY